MMRRLRAAALIATALLSLGAVIQAAGAGAGAATTTAAAAPVSAQTAGTPSLCISNVLDLPGICTNL
jgi:hypothetical protein